jgi:ADP-heptose:LPS heptosyltransferase
MKHTEIKDGLITLACRLLAMLFGAGGRLSGGRSAAAPANILVLKPCCLGDVLMATPVVAALRRGYPGARITFAVGGWSRVGLAGNPNVDAFIDCGPVGSGRYRLADYLRLAQGLRRGHFDLAVTLDRSPAVGLLPFLAGIPQRVGLDSGRRGFAHTRRVAVDWQHPKHETELYLDCVRAIGLPVDDPRLEFFPSAADRAWAAGIASSPAETRLVALHPGGAANPGMTLLAKRWNPRGFAAVADRIVETYGVRIVLVGAPSDAKAVEAVSELMRYHPLNMSGQTTLGQLGGPVRAMLTHARQR